MIHPDVSPIPVSTVYVNGSGPGGFVPPAECWMADSHACSAKKMRADFEPMCVRARLLVFRKGECRQASSSVIALQGHFVLPPRSRVGINLILL